MPGSPNANANGKEVAVRKNGGNNTPDTVIAMATNPPATQWHDGNPVFSLYERLNLKLLSVSLTPEVKEGKVKKAYKPLGKWKEESERIKNLKAGTHYALITGKRGGISVIDIDDPNTETAKELMDLMTDCNMVAKTNKGYHYCYKYTDEVKQTTSEEYKIDIRNDGGIIFCQPSQLWYKGDCLAKYEWIKEPMEDDIEEMPQEVLDYLKGLDQRFVKGAEVDVAQPKLAFTAPESDSETNSVVSVAPAPAPAPEVVVDHELVAVAMALPDAVLKNYQDWLDIGIIFYNKKLTWQDWDKVSKRPNIGYEAGACSKKWGTFTDRRSKQLTEATLWHKLKKHNPAKFYELMETRKDFLDMLELLNSNDIAKYFYNILPDKYVYNEHLGWYSLNPQNIWTHSEKPIPSGIKGDISNTFQQLCLDTKKAILTRYAKDAGATADQAKHKELKEQCDAKVTLIHKSYKQLGGADFCSGVISFLDTYYNDPDLEQKMDMNPQLFAFTDGLYDLEKGKFRPITPQDMISTTTGYAVPKLNPTVRKEIDKFLYGLYEDAPSTEFLLQVLASALLGYNKFEKFYVFTGAGGNGKGVITELITKAFGNYFYPVNVSLFTKIQERLDQPVPALVDARCKRIMMSTEPETNEKLQVSMLKKISGGDPVEARTLHSKHIFKAKPMYKPFFQANDIPKLSKVDTATQRRMEILKFPFNFVATPTQPHERQGDPDVKNVKCSSEAWRDEFILMLTEVYNKSVKNAKHLNTPDKFKEATNEYIDDNNPLKLWLNTNYDLTKSEQDIITAKDLKASYMADTHTEKCDDRWFKQLLTFNGITHGRTGVGAVYKGLKRKEVIVKPVANTVAPTTSIYGFSPDM